MTPDRPVRREDYEALVDQVGQLTDRVATLEHLLGLVANVLDRSRRRGIFEQPTLGDIKDSNRMMTEVWSTMRAAIPPSPRRAAAPPVDPYRSPVPEDLA